MRAVVACWLAQAVVLLAVERSVFGWLWLMTSVAIAVQALHASVRMRGDATVMCALMAIGASVWHIRHGLPIHTTSFLAVAFMTPLVWRAMRMPS